MTFSMLCLAMICIAVLTALGASKQYPVPIPKGGRRDVHGWLILPTDQPTPANGTAPALEAWFSHHVPEFFTDSPHNFQIILKGKLHPTPCVKGELYALDIPVPPQANLLSLEYSFTPPSPFSLNDLLSSELVDLNGVYFIGSFDTSFERIPQSLARLHIEDLTTATYLRENETDAFTNLRYLSYPRGGVSSTHFYFVHEIRQQPDFDHVVHVTVDECSGGFGAEKLIYVPGSCFLVILTAVVI